MKNIQDFYNKIKDIRYGWHDKDGNINEKIVNFRENFILQDKETILKDRYAICWEMCEIQREFFNKNNIENKTISAYLNNSRNNACHTFSVFFLNNKCYWFEASWINKKGIREFNSLNEVLEYFRNNFQDFARSEYDKNNLLFFEYDRVTPGTTVDDFYKNFLNGKKL